MTWPPNFGTATDWVLLGVACLLLFIVDKVRVRSTDGPEAARPAAMRPQKSRETPQEAPYDDRDLRTQVRALQGDVNALKAAQWRLEREMKQ